MPNTAKVSKLGVVGVLGSVETHRGVKLTVTKTAGGVGLRVTSKAIGSRLVTMTGDEVVALGMLLVRSQQL